jgi:uncharacterized protein YbdZ (MbtH family)
MECTDQFSLERAVRQLPAGHTVNKEAENTRENIENWIRLVRATASCRMCELATAL